MVRAEEASESSLGGCLVSRPLRHSDGLWVLARDEPLHGHEFTVVTDIVSSDAFAGHSIAGSEAISEHDLSGKEYGTAT